MRASAILVGLLVLGAGCWNYRDQLERADGHYHAEHYEAAIANLDDLEPAMDDLAPSERARFAYVLGMSHARLGQRADARHWLARAKEMLERGATLPDDARATLQRTLTEVDWVSAPREAGSSGEATAHVASGTEPHDTPPTRPSSPRADDAPRQR